MPIQDDLAALPPADTIEEMRRLVERVRLQYITEMRARAHREKWGDPLRLAQEQAINDAANRVIQLTAARLVPGGSHPADLLTPAERGI
jgi:hypothetical protein